MELEKLKSKIFVRNVTVLDCGVWDLHSGPIGRSWSVDVEWSGTTDAEGVVVDFSQAKKLAKNVIDEKFDHRLLISESLVKPNGRGGFICLPAPSTQPADRFLLDTYKNSLAILPQAIFEGVAENDLSLLQLELAEQILKCSPENVRQVKVKLNQHTQQTQKFYFNYLHSLRLHAGNCQRFHGHSNTVEVYFKGTFDEERSSVAAAVLNGKYLVADCYKKLPQTDVLASLSEFEGCIEYGSGNYVWTGYAGTQGEVTVLVPKDRLLIMPTESTIENIVEWIHANIFNSDPCVEVHAFEGLHKGAIFP
ncbi:MAG: hypothetical protein RL189_2105 [Pseudomonadota bacterium]|jgi:6-pyruvoyl-tetrahydropterin synthase